MIEETQPLASRLPLAWLFSGRVIRSCVLACILALFVPFVTPGPAGAVDEPVLDLTPDEERGWIHRDATGSGFVIPDLDLWIAGYASLVLELPNGEPDEAKIDTLGLLLRYEPTDSLALVVEGELEDALAWIEDDFSGTQDAEYLLDRLHVDYLLTPDLTLRLGKFLTPFGLWNEVRRAPLTWTVERPIATEEVFPVHITGPGLIYNTTTRGWTIDAIGYAQFQDSLLESDEKTAERSAGARLALGRALGPAFVSTGLNFNAFEDPELDRWVDVYGADVDVTIHGHHFTAELAYAELPTDEGGEEWGVYVQDVFPLTERLYAVLRYENFESREDVTSEGILAGLAWRQDRFVLKANYQYTDDPNEEFARGFLFELAFYF